ncbi:Gfo/Idh/MocA family protein [Rhizobium redzepovicii]|uniref:Gfo/Idh/MocA family protein n=1 Tax=Rhizobium redzepovicii TaxID=2867518 RepID=UPI001C92D5EE|nr:Gfo/Idh/MocA family oxidoreductase [Rhizobium redzepovicii]MBY4592592.1 Gfo/Idh/MocA family oxidoreductase [Rhizobium redzepovicii]MBY4615414.1 Gfo/Idh/MocA family oxidoreductase [Rhizobium redzepovicii]
MAQYKIVIIGSGRIADVHALSVARNPGLQLAGFVDPFGGRHFGEKWSIPRYETFPAAIDACKPDALVIASPTETHVSYVLEACRLGLPTLCEKPVAFSREPILEAISAVASSGIPVVLGFHRRFDAYRQEVHARVRAGDVGKVEHILQLSRDPRLAARSELLHQGNIVADMVVHDLDELNWLMGGLPERAYTRLDRNADPTLAEIGVFDTANIMLSWEGGAVAHVSATRRAAHAFEQRLEVFGGEGRIICEDPRISPVIFDGAKDTRIGRRFEHFWDRYRPAYQAEIDHLGDVLAKGVAPLCTLEDGLRAYDLVQLVLSSVQEADRT